MAFAGLTASAVFGGFVLSGSSPGSGSPLAFQSLQQQQRFAAIEVRRLEPVLGAVVETWCVGNCTL
jgi:hypothetical protein